MQGKVKYRKKYKASYSQKHYQRKKFKTIEFEENWQQFVKKDCRRAIHTQKLNRKTRS